jgi:hypothetical protein
MVGGSSGNKGGLDASVAAVRQFEAEMEAACDELSLVIKGFHAIEKRIEAALLNALSVPDALELRRVSLLLKVDILVALGFLQQQQRPLFDRTNAVRNTYAHNPHKAFSDQDFAELLGSLRAHVPGFRAEQVTTPIDSLKYLFTVTYFYSYFALEQAVAARAGGYVAGLYVAELRKEKASQRMFSEMHEEVEQKLRAFLEENSPEFNTDEMAYEVLHRRKAKGTGSH